MESIREAMHTTVAKVGVWTTDLQAAYEVRKAHVKHFVEAWIKLRFHEQAEVLVDRIPSYVKQKLYDPDMPKFVERLLDRTIRKLWPDVKQEIMWEVSVMIDGNEDAYDEELDNTPGPCWVLAFLRYRLFPHDKGVWQCVRDPTYLVVNVLCVIPVYGIWAWMFLVIFCIIDKRDEYQLIYFILSFKGCQFFSWGIIKGLVGFLQYFGCVTFPNMSALATRGEQTPDPSRCMTDGPGMAEEHVILVASWLLPLTLVWICLLLLPGAKEKGRSKLKILKNEAPSNADIREDGQSDAGEQANTKSGGYLTGMVIFDLVIFILCVGMLIIIIATQPHTGTGSQMSKLYNAKDNDWQVKQTFYCCQFIYGLFSIVFVPFNFPLLQAVLTHAVPTAYDSKGRCCKFKGAKPPKSEQAEEIRQGSSLPLRTEDVEGFMSNLKTIMAGGAVSIDEMKMKVNDCAGGGKSNWRRQIEAAANMPDNPTPEQIPTEHHLVGQLR